MNRILIILFFLLSKGLLSKEILVNITGVAKVGKQCFFSFEIKDQSTLNIKNIDLLIYSLDKDSTLIGSSKIALKNLRKKQPYNTFSAIKMNTIDLCTKIRKIDLVVNNCLLKNEKILENCLNFFRLDDQNPFYETIEINFSEHNNYYLDNASEDFFIPELDIKLRVLDMKTAKYYKIKNYKNGLVVVNNNSSSFQEGDLIIEAEMNSIFKIKDLNEKIKTVKNNKKKSILISLIREQQEKFVAVLLK